MADWAEFEAAAPELAKRAEELFRAHKYLTMATIRKDGGPRISGTEIVLAEGRFLLPAMTGTRRFADLARDPRVAVHSGSGREEDWKGDAKVTGRAVPAIGTPDEEVVRRAHPESPPGDFDLVRVDLDEVTVVRVDMERQKLLIETWRPGQEVRVAER